MAEQLTVDAAVGFLMPLLIALANQSHWSPKVRAVSAFALCFAATVVVQWIRGELNALNWHDGATLAVIFGVAVASYKVWWQPSTIAPSIEAATTRARGR